MSNVLFIRLSSLAAILSLLVGVGGCNSASILDQGYVPDRPDYGDTALPNPGPETTPPHVNIINPEPPSVSHPQIEEVRGIWTFTTPSTTTRVEHKTADFSQFSLYAGRPGPADKPFVVITVSADRRSLAAADPQTYKVTNTRTYILNGNIASEWRGTTDTGDPFTELMLSRPGDTTGDVCHAIAVPRTDEQRTLALDILRSITWKPNNETKD